MSREKDLSRMNEFVCVDVFYVQVNSLSVMSAQFPDFLG